MMTTCLPLLSLFILMPLVGHTALCPNHAEIKRASRFVSIAYTESHATMYFMVDHHHHSLELHVRLPAIPPFARSASPFYNPTYTYGAVNWGFTEYYKHDFAQQFIEYISLDKPYIHGINVNCQYTSMLENHLLYGHIWIKNTLLR